MSQGRPFDLQEELRIGGRADALRILLSRAAGSDHGHAVEVAESALRHIGARVAAEQASPQCPESWLTGMHDIEQALRQALEVLTGKPPEP